MIPGGGARINPCFAEGDNLGWVTYKLSSHIVHVGPSPHSGHYRSFLTDRLGRGRARMSHRFRVTDDGTPSRVATPALNHLIQTQCYLCFLKRQDDESHQPLPCGGAGSVRSQEGSPDSQMEPTQEV